jgi:hypothetical protein
LVDGVVLPDTPAAAPSCEPMDAIRLAGSMTGVRACAHATERVSSKAAGEHVQNVHFGYMHRGSEGGAVQVQ